MTGAVTYRSGRLRATVHGLKVTLDTGERQATVTSTGATHREQIERAFSQVPRGRKDFTRAASTRCQILQLRDEQGRPV